MFPSFFYSELPTSSASSTEKIGDSSAAGGSSGPSSSSLVDEEKRKKKERKKEKKAQKLAKMRAELMKSMTAKIDELLVGNVSSSSDEEEG
jgi:hypothetical protein